MIQLVLVAIEIRGEEEKICWTQWYSGPTAIARNSHIIIPLVLEQSFFHFTNCRFSFWVQYPKILFIFPLTRDLSVSTPYYFPATFSLHILLHNFLDLTARGMVPNGKCKLLPPGFPLFLLLTKFIGLLVILNVLALLVMTMIHSDTF